MDLSISDICQVEQILVVIGNAVFDEIAGLDGVGQLLVIGAGVLHPLELRPVEPDALGHLVNGLAAVLPPEEDVNIHALAGVDQRGHPAAPDSTRVAVGLDVQEGVVEPVHDHIAAVPQVNATGSNEVSHADMWDGVHAQHQLFGRHGVQHHPVHPGGEGFVHAGAPVEELVEDLRRGLVRVRRLHDGVAALHEVSPGVLLHGLHGTQDLGVVGAVALADLLVLENQKEAPCERFSAADLLDEPDVFLALPLAGGVVLLRQLLPDHVDVPVGVGLAGDALELQPHGRDLQPGGEGGNDPELLLVGAEHKVDGLDFQDLDVAVIRGLNDPVPDVLDRDEVLGELQPFIAFAFCV